MQCAGARRGAGCSGGSGRAASYANPHELSPRIDVDLPTEQAADNVERFGDAPHDDAELGARCDRANDVLDRHTGGERDRRLSNAKGVERSPGINHEGAILAPSMACAYCDRALIASWEKSRGMCDLCADKLLDRRYGLEDKPVRVRMNTPAMRDLLRWD